MDSELGNLRVALRWLISHGNVGGAQRLAGATRPLWINRAYLTEGRQWLEDALALDPSVDTPKDPAAQARALVGLLGVALQQGDLALAEHAGLRGLQLFEALGDTGRAAHALRFLGLAAGARAELAAARRFMEQALVATQDTGQVAALALTLCNLAEFDLEEGDLVAAQRHGEEGLKVATAAGHAAIGCRALVSLGEVHRRLGRLDVAQRHWQAALMRVNEAAGLSMRFARAGSLIPALITLGRQARESEHARGWLVEGLLLARDGSRWDLARGLEAVVEVAAAEGNFELALQLAGAAAALRDRIGTPHWPSEEAWLNAAITGARQRLTEDAADFAWMRGLTRPVDEAVAAALDFLELNPVAGPESAHPQIAPR
jgi:tetratricopeptide (TPR) repeat protein